MKFQQLLMSPDKNIAEHQDCHQMYCFLFLSSLLTSKELDRNPNIVDIMDTTEKKKNWKKIHLQNWGLKIMTKP